MDGHAKVAPGNGRRSHSGRTSYAQSTIRKTIAPPVQRAGRRRRRLARHAAAGARRRRRFRGHHQRQEIRPDHPQRQARRDGDPAQRIAQTRAYAEGNPVQPLPLSARRRCRLVCDHVGAVRRDGEELEPARRRAGGTAARREDRRSGEACRRKSASRCCNAPATAAPSSPPSRKSAAASGTMAAWAMSNGKACRCARSSTA